MFVVSPFVRPGPHIKQCPTPVRYLAKVAQDRKVLEDVHALRYASYLDGGFIQPNPTRKFGDSYDGLKTSITIAVYHGQRAVGSVRVCLLAERASGISPAADTFPEEVSSFFDRPTGRICGPLAEVNRLVRAPEAANNQGLVFLLYRLAGVVLLHAQVGGILSCVRHNHLSFYKRIGFRQVAEPRIYPGLRCPMYLLAGSRAEYDTARSALPLLDPDTLPIASYANFLAGEPITTALMGPAAE